MKKLHALKFLAALAVSVTVANAELITFDDINGTIPNGYHGLNWSNLHTLNATTVTTSGYTNSVISGTNVAYNGGGSDGLIIAGSGNFDFNSGYFTGAWNDGLTLQVLGYNGATLIYNNSWTLNTSGPLFINFNYLDVTSITFHSFGGTPHPGFSGGGEHFAMDNLTINGSVPDSGTSALLLGLALSSLIAFRRRLS